MKFINVTEFSKITGVNRGTVRSAIKSGRITSVERSHAGRIIGINLEKGLSEYQGNTDPSQAMKTSKEKPTKTVLSGNKIIDYQEERAKKEHFVAKTAELEYLKMAGKLVSASAMETCIFETFRKLRNNVFALVTKKSQEIYAVTDPLQVERIIRVELTEIFTEASNGLFKSAATLEASADTE